MFRQSYLRKCSLSIWSTSFHDVLGSETDNYTSHCLYISLLYCTYQLTKNTNISYMKESVFWTGGKLLLLKHKKLHIYALHWYWGSVTFKGAMAVILCYFTKVCQSTALKDNCNCYQLSCFEMSFWSVIWTVCLSVIVWDVDINNERSIVNPCVTSELQNTLAYHARP